MKFAPRGVVLPKRTRNLIGKEETKERDSTREFHRNWEYFGQMEFFQR